MEDIKSEYTFIEMPGVQELEAKLSEQIKDLCERNAYLAQRNAELRDSAEIGWSAGVALKKYEMIEGDLKEEIKKLNFERAAQALELNEKNGQMGRLAAEISRLRKDADNIQAAYAQQAAELSQQLESSRGEASRLVRDINAQSAQHKLILSQVEDKHRQGSDAAQSSFQAQLSDAASLILAAESKAAGMAAELEKQRQEASRLHEQLVGQNQVHNAQLERLRLDNELALSELQQKHEQDMSLAQEKFHAQLSEVGKSSWAAGHELVKLREELEYLRAEARELQKRHQAELRELAQIGLASEQEAKAAKDARSQLEIEFKREYQTLEKTNSELKRIIEDERAKLAQARVRESSVREELDKYSVYVKKYVADSQAERDSLRQQLAEAAQANVNAKSQNEAQKSSITGMSAELNVKIRELREANQTIQKQMNVVSEQSAELGALRIKADHSSRQVSELMVTVEKLNTEIKSKDEVIQRQIKTLSNMGRAEKEKDFELQRIRFAETSLTESVAELRRAGQERDNLQMEMSAHVQRLKDQLAETQSQGNAEILSLNSQLQSARAQLESVRSAMEVMSLERENNRRMNDLSDSKAQAERKELDRLKSLLEQREYQLRQYAVSVSDEKAEVLRRARALADEIKAASTLAPLKDYLALTEFELSKAEMQLRKTPVISVERPRLEMSFNQMIEQRDFLKKAIANSQAQLDQQAAQLIKIAKPERLAPIPPLPPRKPSV